MSKKTIKPKLKRSLTLVTLTLFGLGNIVGAGIYVLIGKVAGVSGYSAPLAFLFAMAIAALTAFSYMELSSRYPEAAGVSAYMHGAFGSKILSMTVGILMLAGGVVSTGVLARGFGGYLSKFIAMPEWLAALLILLVLGGVVLWGIGESAKLAVAFTIVEMVGLGMVIWAGRGYLADFGTNAQFFTSVDPGFGWNGVLVGAFLAFYAFIGFEDIVSVAEEVQRPRRTMPLAILFSLAIATVLYVIVVVVAVRAIPPSELAKSSAPLTLVFERTAGASAVLISLIGISAAVNGILAHMIGMGRLTYGLAKRGWFHKELAQVHMVRQTPVLATILTVAAMIIMALLFPLETLARLTSFLLLCIFILVNVALIAIKRRKQTHAHAIAVPRWVPYAGLISSAGLVLYQIVNR